MTTTDTECSLCLSTFYPSLQSYPATSCDPCTATCSGCFNATFCTGCIAGDMHVVDGNCVCQNIGEFLDSITLTCLPCSQVIVNCVTCEITLPTTCSACSTGTYLSADSLLCLHCDLNCADCTGSGACTSCNSGYMPDGNGSCFCDTTC